MKIQVSQSIDAPCDQVWTAMMDGVQMLPALQHFELAKETSPGSYVGRLIIPVGPVSGVYNGTLTISQAVPPLQCQVGFAGHGERSAVEGNGRIHLEETGQSTIVHFQGEIELTGELADLPPRLLQSNANAVIRRSIRAVRRVIWPEQYVADDKLLSPRNKINSSPETQTAVLALITALAGVILIRIIGPKLFRRAA